MNTKKKADHPGGNDVCPDQARREVLARRPVGNQAARGGPGDVAQLGERLPCKQQASGSIPLISTESWVAREYRQRHWKTGRD